MKIYCFQAKSVLAAIFSMCSIANEMVDGKASEEKMHAATKEVKRATNALVLSYHVEGYPESDSLQKLQVFLNYKIKNYRLCQWRSVKHPVLSPHP